MEDAANPREQKYLWQLARELGTMPIFQWLQDRGSWADIVRLAFQYLDLDADGLLSPQDLVGHIVRATLGEAEESICQEGTPAGSTEWVMSCRWVSRWQDP